MDMTSTWQLQNAKNKLSEVVDRAQHAGPQHITKRGKETAVVISIREYQRMKKKNTTLLEFFRNSPLAGLNIRSARDYPRRVDL
jgi:prevent-host-death family protein